MLTAIKNLGVDGALRIAENILNKNKLTMETNPWWLSDLERQSNSRPMLKVPRLNPATAMDKNYDGFSVCRFASILIDCIETVTLSQVLDWA